MENILPSSVKYEIIEQNYEDSENWECILKLKLKSQEQWKTWLSEFESETTTKYIFRTSVPETKFTKFHFSENYECQHSSYNKVKDSKKNQDCKATINVRIKKDSPSIRSRDEYCKRGFFTTATIKFHHSHRVINAEAWNQLRVSKDTENVFHEYYKKGMSPSDAKHYHQKLVRKEQGEFRVGDKSVNPPKEWIYYKFDIWRRKEFGGVSHDDSFFENMDKKQKELEERGMLVSTSKDPMAAAICTPMMQRLVSTLPPRTSLFVDSSASVDQTNSSLTFVLAPTKAGAVPVGMIIHDSQSEASYTTGFNLLRKLWHTKNSDPIVENFMTDDSAAMRNAIATVWPGVRQLLCQFHVLQALWRWLWDAKNAIEKEHRKYLMDGFKCIMYEKTESDADNKYEELVSSEIASKYITFKRHLTHIFSRKNEWCSAHRKDVLNRGDNTNNYSEASVRTFKDNVLERVKAFNAIALMDSVCIELEHYYQERLEDHAFGRNNIKYLLSKKTIDAGSKIIDVQCNGAHNYLVKSQSMDNHYYEVDSTLGVCTCIAGVQGAFCKHQSAVQIKYNAMFPNHPKKSESDSILLYQIAFGFNVKLPAERFFAPMSLATESLLQPLHINILNSNQGQTNAIAVNIAENSEASDSENNELNLVNLSENFVEKMQKFGAMMRESTGNEYVAKQVHQFLRDANKVTSIMKLGQFFSRHNANFSYHKGRKIRVNAEAIKRRTYRTGSCKVQRSGKTLKGIKKTNKRERCLSLNVRLNRPNGKSHGVAH